MLDDICLSNVGAIMRLEDDRVPAELEHGFRAFRCSIRMNSLAILLASFEKRCKIFSIRGAVVFNRLEFRLEELVEDNVHCGSPFTLGFARSMVVGFPWNDHRIPYIKCIVKRFFEVFEKNIFLLFFNDFGIVFLFSLHIFLERASFFSHKFKSTTTLMAKTDGPSLHNFLFDLIVFCVPFWIAENALYFPSGAFCIFIDILP